jgi:type IV pilus assembly protein PilM
LAPALLRFAGVLNVLRSKTRGTPRVIGIELGGLTSRAVHLERDGDQLKVLKFSVRESPLKQENLTPAVLAEHFQRLAKDLQAHTKDIIVSLGMEEAILQRVQMPRTSNEELRQILKLSGSKYFPQDITNHVFDVAIVQRTNSGIPQPPSMRSQAEVLVAGARRDLVDLVKKAAKLAGLRLMEVSLTMIGLADALRVATPELLTQKPVVVGKLGFTYASVTVLLEGVPVFTRILDIDGEQLSKGLSEAYKVPRHIPDDYQIDYIRSRLKLVFARLVQDFKSAMDFFEAEYEQKVAAGFMFGELVVSKLALETLQDLDVPCAQFDAQKLCTLEATPEESTWFTQELPQLVAAIGSAGGWLKGDRVPLNLIAEDIEERARRRRDPVRHVAFAACLIIAALLFWAGQLRVRLWSVERELKNDSAERTEWERMRRELTLAKGRLADANDTLASFQTHYTNRFVFGSALDALQHAAMDDIQLTRLTLQETVANTAEKKGISEKNRTVPRQPAFTTEKVSLTLQAKNFAGPEEREKFIEKITSVPYFKQQLRKAEPVVLRNHLARQIDPLDPSRTFNLFTIECMYPDRVVGYD